eukprot:3409978-Heterocapsa_arctica.AAC.1
MSATPLTWLEGMSPERTRAARQGLPVAAGGSRRAPFGRPPTPPSSRPQWRSRRPWPCNR